MISSNHYQAPVRRFILDLFDVQLNPDVLVQLVKMEQTSLKLVREKQGNGHAQERGRDHDHAEHRRRATSSPGPEPLGRGGGSDAPVLGMRSRGLTISKMEGQAPTDLQQGGLPRARMTGGFD
jgi:hypothetical protein